jgi:NitT/TauT family transport system substrate-binding protein
MKKFLSLKYLIIHSLIIYSLFLFGCANKSDNIGDIKRTVPANIPENAENYNINIAEQYGLAYAPLQIMKSNKLLEKNLPGIKITWQQVSNTAAIREAMVSNKIDAGFMAIPPFLIGLDKGMEWKIATGLSSSSVELITNKNNIQSLKDFLKEDKIALPQPGSVQHILLSMACENQLKDSHKLDNNLITLSHPDGMNALINNSIAAHFTSPPYSFKELENKNMHVVLDGKEALGEDFTFIVGVTTKKFHDDTPKAYTAFIKSINEAIDLINNNPEKSAEILAPIYNLSKEETLKYLTLKDNKYSSEVKGLSKFSDFMKKNNYISKSYNIKDTIWENDSHEK